MEFLKTELSARIAAIIEECLPEASDRNRKDFGRTAVVNRIRGGKVQMRKRVSEVKGYKISNGQLVRMKPVEIRKRKRAARISARKRKTEMARILRNRKISLQKRKTRLGA